MRVIFLPGLDVTQPGDALGRFVRGLRAMDGVTFSDRDDPVAVGRRWCRLDGRLDVDITEIFWNTTDSYMQTPSNVFMRTSIGIWSFVLWITNRALWTAATGRGGIRFAFSILLGFTLFGLWGTAGVVALADALGLTANVADANAGLLEKLREPIFAKVELWMVLLVAIGLSVFQVDRYVMSSAYLADFDRNHSGMRSAVTATCRMLMQDVLKRDAPATPGEKIVIVGHSMGGTVALDLVLDMVSGEGWPPVEVTLITFGAPVRMFRSSRAPGSGPSLFAAARDAPGTPGPAASTGVSRVAWIDLYSGRDYFSAPMFDHAFTGSRAGVALSYTPQCLDDLNADASFIARVRGKPHNTYLHDAAALEVVLRQLREAG